MADVDVLVVGAGPVGLTAAVELRRRGVDCRIIDRLAAPARFAKAVGIQPRTLEVWDAMGVLHDALDSAAPLRGQLLYVNGEQVAQMDFQVPHNVPYGFAALPQYETERILASRLADLGAVVERGVELSSFAQHRDGVEVRVSGPSGDEDIAARFVLGCDGAHSTVRAGLGLSFEGDAFPEQYMLGDVEVDWDMPPGYAIRATHQGEAGVDDLLVCIPLPGRKRYRMSMLVPPELAMPAGDAVAHGLESGQPPELRHVQAVLDRLGPQPTKASNLRWSSVFRISHRLVGGYGGPRVFVAGDAAHIHPPTGAQGMNTGIQDAYNLAWKIALSVEGIAAPALLDSYDQERRPVGEEVVGRTVRHARAGFEADPDDPSVLLQREAQLLVNYRGSPIVAPREPDGSGLSPGDRAPDCPGLVRPIVNFSLRLFELLRSTGHTLFLYADHHADLSGFEELVAVARERAHGRLTVHAVLASDIDPRDVRLPVILDRDRRFQATYGARGGDGWLVRPDGYLGYRGRPANEKGLRAYLAGVFAE